MQTARERNSAVERAISAQQDPGTGSDAAPPGRVPQLPHQCSLCQRWVDKGRLALMPIGYSPWCSICHAVDQVKGAIAESQLSDAKEAEVLETLFDVFELLRGRGGRPASGNWKG